MPTLNVPAMTEPILDNYNHHVLNLMGFLRRQLQCHLIYEGPRDLQIHLFERTVYSCSIYKSSKKTIRDVFPVMIGSHLDLAIRHLGVTAFPNDTVPRLSASPPFEDVDIGTGFFIVNGFLRHLPYFYTNDPTNTHIVQRKMVRVYAYDSLDRGKELSYYVTDTRKHRYGDRVVSHNDGRVTLNDTQFFDHCSYPTHLSAYMAFLHARDLFRIDHLGNKSIVSSGHLFVRLLLKHLYKPLRDNNWTEVKSKANLVRKSIETGDLLHVLSQKTHFYKEGASAAGGKPVVQESHREIGANGKVFVEKSIGCYREVNTQTYPLNPYLLYVIVRQVSQRVKHFALDPLPPSYEGFLCILGCFETKNVGRTTMMVRGTVVSTCDALDPVYRPEGSPAFWDALQLEPAAGDSPYYVVVNEACIPVTRRCFVRVDLLRLKQTFRTLECYHPDADAPFIVIRYKMGLILKRLPGTELWITPYDEMYWAHRLFSMTLKEHVLEKGGFDYLTSYLVDLNSFFHQNGFPKNILGFNALKNAVLATTSRYARYFMDSLSAYLKRPKSHHRVVVQPEEDGVSRHFVLRIPHLMVSYSSLEGCAQEDCIVQRRDVDAFDCFRFYTLRFKVETEGTIQFRAVHGSPDADDFLGTIVSDRDVRVESFSIHVRVVQPTSTRCHLHFSKPPFRVIQSFITQDKLTVCLEQEHVSSAGDKLCSFHGQKGVICIKDKVLTLDGHVQPDLVVNPYCLYRLTTGQIHESVVLGGCRDSRTVHNSDGVLIPGAKALYGSTYYFSIAYWSSEHLYAPEKCTMDRVLGQAVKGRSRGGGMRLGNMELFNALRGNGLASTFEEKFFEDGDRVVQDAKRYPTVALPKAINLVQEDAKFFKCNLEYETVPSVRVWDPLVDLGFLSPLFYAA